MEETEIVIIPKGTLLFRRVKDPMSDFKGVLLNSGKRCVTPDYNVFFHLDPFVGENALGKFISDCGNNVYVYMVKRDLKLLKLLDRFDERYVKPCSQTKQYCLPFIRNSYDPCMNIDFVKKHPDIVGMLTVSAGDNFRFVKENKAKTLPKKYSKYIIYHKGLGAYLGDNLIKMRMFPEIILHPFATRNKKAMIMDDSHHPNLNYEIIGAFHTTDKEKILNFMKNHTKFDRKNGLYQYKD